MTYKYTVTVTELDLSIKLYRDGKLYKKYYAQLLKKLDGVSSKYLECAVKYLEFELNHGYITDVDEMFVLDKTYKDVFVDVMYDEEISAARHGFAALDQRIGNIVIE